MRLIVFIILCFSISEALASSLDTVNIYLSESSISMKKLKKIWFPTPGMFSYSPTNRQDEIVTDVSIHYFKVYDRSRHLLLEGEKTKYQCLKGLVKFYYPNGKIKREEFYRIDPEFDGTESNAMDSIVRDFDATQPWDTWTYYNKRGQVKKTIVYSVVKLQERNELCETVTTTIFGRHNEIKSRQQATKECRKNNGS